MMPNLINYLMLYLFFLLNGDVVIYRFIETIYKIAKLQIS